MARARPRVTNSRAVDGETVSAGRITSSWTQVLLRSLLTFADVDDECTRDGRCINPFAGEVLDLETRVRRCLEELCDMVPSQGVEHGSLKARGDRLRM